jgi:uncharacterized protein (UPF0548 family)
MDVLLKNAPAQMDSWRNRAITGLKAGPSDHWDCYRRPLAREAAGPPGPTFRHLANCILDYQIFPEHLIRAVKAPGPLSAGDTVGVRFVGFPLVDLFFACRVLRTFASEEEGRWCEGFVYQTLAGHPERGEERFAVEKDLQTGEIWGQLSSWSGPGLWFIWLGEPLVRRLQHYANTAALTELERKAGIQGDLSPG